MKDAHVADRDYKEMAREAVTLLPDEHLLRYVQDYEDGILNHQQNWSDGRAHCAVQSMLNNDPCEESRPNYHRWCEGAKCKPYSDRPQQFREEPLIVIETIFEGWQGGQLVPAVERRRIIYDACVFELAGRDAVLLESEKVVMDPTELAILISEGN